MQKDKREKRSKDVSDGAINALGGEPGSIGNESEYEERFRELPPNEKQLAEKTARLADLCQYFSEHQIDIPSEIAERVAGLSKLTIPERVRALVELHHDLMQYLDRTGEHSGIRQ